MANNSLGGERRIRVAKTMEIPVALDGSLDGPPLILSNSLASSFGVWDEFVARMSPHARLVRYDLRGHGAADAPDGDLSLDDLGRDALAVMDALGLERAVFCGLSLGGLIGMWLALHAPERISALVLANTAANFPPAEMWAERARNVRANGMSAILEPTLARWFTPSYANAHPQRIAEIAGMIAATSPAGYAACCEVLARSDCLPALDRIACPTLVMTGRSDASTPAARAEEIAARIPGAEMALLDAAHISPVEAADAFAQRVRDFIAAAR